MYDQQDDFQEKNNKHFSSRKTSNSLVTASLVCALLAVLTLCTIYGTVIFASLSIVLALLSRGNSQKLQGAAKGNVILSLVALGIGLTVIISSFSYVFTTFGSPENFMNYYTEMLEEEYGISPEMLNPDYESPDFSNSDLPESSTPDSELLFLDPDGQTL